MFVGNLKNRSLAKIALDLILKSMSNAINLQLAFFGNIQKNQLWIKTQNYYTFAVRKIVRNLNLCSTYCWSIEKH